MSENNPWLGITKQVESASKALFKVLPTLPEDCVKTEDQYEEDLKIIAQMRHDYEGIPAEKYKEKYFEYFSEMEMDIIELMFKNDDCVEDVLEWIYEKG